MSRCLSKEEQMEKSKSFKDFRGVCDFTEDGHGGFKMNSVYYDQHGGEKHVSSVFKLKSEVDSEEEEWEEVYNSTWNPEEKGEWKPDKFNFKAAIGGSPSKEQIKKKHHLKKVGSRRAGQTKVSSVRRHLGAALDDSFSSVMEDVTNRLEEMSKGGEDYKKKDQGIEEEDKASDDLRKKLTEELTIEYYKQEQIEKAIEAYFLDILMDVTDRFEEMTQKIKCTYLKGRMDEDLVVSEDSLKELLERHGEDCDCKDYVQGLSEYYRALSHFPPDILKKVVETNHTEVDQMLDEVFQEED